MAVPTSPDLTSITTEGLKKSGYSSPSSAALTRAQDEWMEEIKNDIWIIAKKLKSLQTTSILVTTDGLGRYARPSDYSSDLTMTLLDGNETGTAQAGTTSSITLQASKSYGTDWMKRKYILVTSGTGQASMSQCTSYNDTSKLANVSPDFNTSPDSTSVYKIVDVQYPLSPQPIWDFDSEMYAMDRDRPSHYALMGDADNGELVLFKVPDKSTYGLQLRYYADLMELDLAGTLMATLYKRWRNLFIFGVYAKSLQNDDDSRQNNVLREYGKRLQLLVMREQYGMDLSNLSMKISD